MLYKTKCKKGQAFIKNIFSEPIQYIQPRSGLVPAFYFPPAFGGVVIQIKALRAFKFLVSHIEVLFIGNTKKKKIFRHLKIYVN